MELETMHEYRFNTRVRLLMRYRRQGELDDPRQVALVVVPPGKISHIFYEGGGLRHPSPGVYYVEMLADQAGRWTFRWTAGGRVAVGAFNVIPEEDEHV